MNKKCRIDNGKYCWTLIVDGQHIMFEGRSSADYFSKHYSKLGYAISFTNSYNGDGTTEFFSFNDMFQDFYAIKGKSIEEEK